MANKLFSGTLILSLSNSSIRIISFILLPIMTMYLTPSDYGIISIVVLINTFISIILNPGLISATMRLFYDYETEQDKIELFGSALILFLFISVIVCGFFIYYGEYLSKYFLSEFPFYPYGIYAIIIAFLTQTTKLWDILYRIRNKIISIAIISFINVLINLSVSIYTVVYLDYGVYGRILGMLVASSFSFIFTFSILIKYTRFNFSLPIIKKIIFLGYPLLFGIIATAILNVGDRLIIEKFLGLAKLGIYETAYKIGTVPIFLSVGFKKMWVPYFYENVKSNNIKDIKKDSKAFISILIFGILSLLIILPEVYTFLIGTKYWEGIKLVPPIILGTYLLLLSIITNAILSYDKKFKLITLFLIVAAVTNILLNIFLIKYFGIIVASIATFFAYFIQFYLSFIYTKKTKHSLINSKIFWGSIILLIVSSLHIYVYGVYFSTYILLSKIIFVILFAFLIKKIFLADFKFK